MPDRMLRRHCRPTRMPHRNPSPRGHRLKHNLYPSALTGSKIPPPPLKLKSSWRLPGCNHALLEHLRSGSRLKLLRKPPAQPRLKPHQTAFFPRDPKPRPTPPPQIGLLGENGERRCGIRRNSNAHSHNIGSRRSHRLPFDRSTCSRNESNCPAQNDSTSSSHPRS
jgi:hypothetical protein